VKDVHLRIFCWFLEALSLLACMAENVRLIVSYYPQNVVVCLDSFLDNLKLLIVLSHGQ